MATFTSAIGFLGAVALAATACAVPALGQSFDIRTLFSAPPPNSGAAAAPTGSGTQEWSGTLTGDPSRRGQFPQLPCRTLAAGAAPRRPSRSVRG